MDKHQWTTRKLLLALSWPAVVRLGLATATEGGGGAPVRRCTALGLTELGQRALGEAMWCWGDGGGISVMEEWPDKPVAGNDGGGERCCSCGRYERRRGADSAKWGRG